MADKQSKGKKARVSPQKRNAQNRRTFLNVQKRRAKHAKAHGITVDDIPAKRWISAPTSKGVGSMMG